MTSRLHRLAPRVAWVLGLRLAFRVACVLGLSLGWSGSLDAQTPSQQECRGLTAGSLLLSEAVGAVFVAEYRAGGVALKALFLVLGAPGWDTRDLTFQPQYRPQLPDTTRFLTGASIGRLFLQYDPAAHVAWVDTIRLRLSDDNVIVVDSAHTTSPVIRSVDRVDSAMPMHDACAARERNDFESLRKAVFEKLLREPALRRLITERSGLYGGR
jgi:hypothetical protein